MADHIRFHPPPQPPPLPNQQHHHHHHQQQQQQLRPSRKRWGGCWGGLSCFGKQKGGKRIVPASRIPEASSSSTANQANAAAGLNSNSHTTALGPSLLAPPSSPASFSNSALQSTAQSPNCFLSANSPGGPSMYATGPYAHEMQLVSPPVFSTFTTEPSTAPLTPPPELAHLTTPSSPDVPFAQFLSSAADIKSNGKNNNYISCNDLQATYSLYPGSPASSLRSPVSRASGDHHLSSSSFAERERDFSSQWVPSLPSQENKYGGSESGRLFGLETAGAKLAQDSNFFCPATFAQFYLDPSSFPQSGGRLSVSRESDAYSNAGTGNGHQNRQVKPSKPDAEEIEAYRASFGFSADEIVTTAQYVEISEGLEDSFTITPFTSDKPHEESIFNASSTEEGLKAEKVQKLLPGAQSNNSELNYEGSNYPIRSPSEGIEGKQRDVSGHSAPGNHALSDDDDIFSKMKTSRTSRKYHQLGSSNSDAEVEYRRRRSLRERKGEFAWHD